MAIRFRCSRCDQLSSIASNKAGQSVRCPTCDAEIVVPTEDLGWAYASPDSSPPETVREPPRTTQPSAPEKAPPHSAEFEDEELDDVGFRLRKRPSPVDDMDLTPMVDVTFLLLIFFMVTASFSIQKALQFPAPQPDEKGAQQTVQMLEDFEATSVIVQIDARNAISVDYQPLTDARDLPNVFRDKLRTEQKAEVLIDAHSASWHETVVAVVDAANEAGMQRIRLASRAADRG